MFSSKVVRFFKIGFLPLPLHLIQYYLPQTANIMQGKGSLFLFFHDTVWCFLSHWPEPGHKLPDPITVNNIIQFNVWLKILLAYLRGQGGVNIFNLHGEFEEGWIWKRKMKISLEKYKNESYGGHWDTFIILFPSSSYTSLPSSQICSSSVPL